MQNEKRVLIVTFNRCYNFGAMLQCYALQKKMLELGMSVEHLDRKEQNRENKFDLKQILIDFRDRKRNKLFEKFQKEFLIYTKRKYCSTEYNKLNKSYSHFIAGSDQVWNCKNGIRGEFFLEFVSENNKRISYAASIGLEKIPECYEKKFKEDVEKFDYISMREKTGAELVRNLTGREVRVVLDPVFLIPDKEWIRILVHPKIRNYIFVYGFDVSEKMKRYISKLKRITGKKVISVYKIKGIDIDYVVGTKIGPLEFLGYTYCADYVVTSSFHCTAFSLMFNKKCIIEHHGGTGSRTRDLLEMVKYYQNPELDNLEQWSSEKIEFGDVNARLNELREEAERFLVEAMK